VSGFVDGWDDARPSLGSIYRDDDKEVAMVDVIGAWAWARQTFGGAELGDARLSKD